MECSKNWLQSGFYYDVTMCYLCNLCNWKFPYKTFNITKKKHIETKKKRKKKHDKNNKSEKKCVFTVTMDI